MAHARVLSIDPPLTKVGRHVIPVSFSFEKVVLGLNPVHNWCRNAHCAPLSMLLVVVVLFTPTIVDSGHWSEKANNEEIIEDWKNIEPGNNMALTGPFFADSPQTLAIERCCYAARFSIVVRESMHSSETIPGRQERKKRRREKRRKRRNFYH